VSPVLESYSCLTHIKEVDKNTKVDHVTDSRLIRIDDVTCAAERNDLVPEQIICMSVELELSSISSMSTVFLPASMIVESKSADMAQSAANCFLSDLNAIQRELLVHYLRFPRDGEIILFKRYEAHFFLLH
jgi:hypothetical protein